MALRARKVSGAFEKRAPGPQGFRMEECTEQRIAKRTRKDIAERREIHNAREAHIAGRSHRNAGANPLATNSWISERETH